MLSLTALSFCFLAVGCGFLLRVGIAGLGHMGQLHMLNAMRVDGVDVVAGADKYLKNRKFAERFHAKSYDDYSKLLDSEELDAVIISLPNYVKKDCVFYAADRGLDIFLDKPIARNLAEANEVLGKVKKENVRMMVGVNYRYFPCVQKIKSKLDSGEIGDTVIATSELVMNGPISHALVPAPVPDWWLDKNLAGGGALLDLGYHLIDVLCWMLGDFDVAYSCLGHKLNLPIEDTGTIVLKSKTSDTTGIVNVGWFSKSIFPDFNFRINMHGTVSFDSTDRYIPNNPRVNALKEGLCNLARRIIQKKPTYLSYTYYYASFYKIIQQFFEALKTGADFPVSLDKQLDVIRLIDTAYSKNEWK
ncbi:MAG: Gfo/Idh/MocA family oxidoreductase [Candidatus Bathyarchaeota archaeon]|nr:Gfo/Idh/MocA family oxidoreductase [Candidatus Bathyarchaeota archaeon]